jgi:hypothetical protein
MAKLRHIALAVPDPEKAAVLIRRHIEAKRRALGLPALDDAAVVAPEAPAVPVGA